MLKEIFAATWQHQASYHTSHSLCYALFAIQSKFGTICLPPFSKIETMHLWSLCLIQVKRWKTLSGSHWRGKVVYSCFVMVLRNLSIVGRKLWQIKWKIQVAREFISRIIFLYHKIFLFKIKLCRHHFSYILVIVYNFRQNPLLSEQTSSMQISFSTIISFNNCS